MKFASFGDGCANKWAVAPEEMALGTDSIDNISYKGKDSSTTMPTGKNKKHSPLVLNKSLN